MLKKILCAVMLLLPLCASAQLGEGKWVIHHKFASANLQNIIDTETDVYYLVSNGLFRYNKSTGENVSLSKSNILSENLVSNIYYNYSKHYLVVTYTNSNLDVIKSDGTVVNFSNIKDVVLNTSKTINDVSFGSDAFYVATSFGFLVIDDTEMQVRALRNFGIGVATATEVGDLVMFSNGSRLYYTRKDAAAQDRTANFNSFSGTFTSAKFYPISDTKFFCATSAAFSVYTITQDGTTYTFTPTQVVAAAANNVQRTPSGFIANFLAKSYYYTFDADGGSATQVSGGAELYSQSPYADGTMWAVGANGLHVAGSADCVKPDGYNISRNPYWATYNKALDQMYLSSASQTYQLLGTDYSGKGQCAINMFDGTSWTDITPSYSFPSDGWYDPILNPLDPNMYFIAARSNGYVYRIENNAVAARYTVDNSPFLIKRKAHMAFDSQGNLWAVHSNAYTGSGSSLVQNTTPVKVLPNNKLTATPAKANWIIQNVPNTNTTNSFQQASFVIPKQSDFKVYTIGDAHNPIIIWDNEGDINNTNPRSRTFANFTDQDGRAYTWLYALSLACDNDGMVWMGTNSGVISFDPTKAFDDDFAINHIKLAKDGTYLLEGQQVNAIAADTLNRKWIATECDGVYLVSPSGDEIIKHFDTSNSPLPADKVFHVGVKASDNSVFITTIDGVAQYFSDVTPYADNYDNVSAFPNPVLPDFTGYISIEGLMNDSHLIITDSEGNVVKTLVSEGGVAVWDGCLDNGERVPTGSYNVKAAQEGNEPQYVTRIMIVR